MTDTLTRTASFDVDLPANQALELFTPEGERSWVQGWDPVYADPARRGGPDTVFQTSHGDGPVTVWVLTEQTDHHLSYARWTPGVSAGTVTVTITPTVHGGATLVTVRYALTALTDDGRSILDRFGVHYDDYIASWGVEIQARP